MTAPRLIALALLLVVGSTICLSSAVSAPGVLEDALKVFGIAFVVRTFGGDLNNFVTRLASQRGVEWEGATKVVPIVSVGSGLFVGAAQVVGSPDRVDDVRGVGQVETRISAARAKLLVPINTTTPGRKLTRIKGVGVSAILDFKI